MKKNRKKGRVLATIQFTLLIVIFVSAYIEKTHYEHPAQEIITIISIVLLITGVVSTLLTLIEFNQYMTPNPVPLDNALLRMGGIYSVVRHPMYLSVVILLIGGTLYIRAYITLILDLLAILFLVYKINFEEKMLVEKYDAYREYQKKTKKLLPFIY